MNGKFQGKVVLVTGGSRGIGKAIAERFYTEGATVAITYLNHFEDAKDLLRKYPEIMVEKCDVRVRTSVSHAVNSIVEKTKSIDLIINSAGVMITGKFTDFDEEVYRTTMDTNLKGIIYVVLETFPFLKRSKNAAIINIASNAGIGTAMPGTTLYAISKAGVIMLTKRLAYEFADDRIRVNAIAPGWVETDMTVQGKSQDEIDNIKRYFKSHSTTGRTGVVQDVASAAIYLASEESSFMNGQVLVIDGGRTDNLTHSI